MSDQESQSENDRDSPSPQHHRQTPSHDGDEDSIRSVVGGGAVKLSETVNNNLIVARYTAFASITLLAAYGIAHTPLFFRYRTVADLPSHYFTNRKTITCRVIRTEHDQPEGPIYFELRHLSPIERLLSKSSFDRLMKMHPSASFGKRPDESKQELLKVQLAGVTTPPDYFSYNEQPGEWLNRFAQQRPTVKCQLLARRVQVLDEESSLPKKRQIPEFQSNKETFSKHQVAIAKLYHRPAKHWFAKDLAKSLTEFGRASVADGLYSTSGSSSSQESVSKIVDTTTSVKDLEKDAAYLSRLAKAEYNAAKGQYGMWADSSIRDARPDIVEEVDFQTKAPLWKKVWRWIRNN